MDLRRTPWRDIPGGSALMEYFGHDPIFHDGEIVQLLLNRRSQSMLTIHIWGMDNVEPVKHAVVTCLLEDIIDIELENFSDQNVIGDLIIRLLPDREDRRPYYPRATRPSDIEIELLAIYGVHGVICAGSLAMSFVPGLPQDER